MNRSKRSLVLAAVAVLGVLSPAHAADLLVSSALDGGDNGNRTTRGNESASCLGGAPGCDGAIAGCTFADCGVTHSLGEIFDGTFRLVAGSPAIGAGIDSLFHGGAERVPAADFEGDPRPEGLPSIGFDESP